MISWPVGQWGKTEQNGTTNTWTLSPHMKWQLTRLSIDTNEVAGMNVSITNMIQAVEIRWAKPVSGKGRSSLITPPSQSTTRITRHSRSTHFGFILMCGSHVTWLWKWSPKTRQFLQQGGNDYPEICLTLYGDPPVYRSAWQQFCHGFVGRFEGNCSWCSMLYMAVNHNQMQVTQRCTRQVIDCTAKNILLKTLLQGTPFSCAVPGDVLPTCTVKA